MKLFDKKFDGGVRRQEQRVQKKLNSNEGQRLVRQYGWQKTVGALRQQENGTHKDDYILGRNMPKRFS